MDVFGVMEWWIDACPRPSPNAMAAGDHSATKEGIIGVVDGGEVTTLQLETRNLKPLSIFNIQFSIGVTCT